MLFEKEGICTFLNWTFSWSTFPVTGWESNPPDSPGTVMMDYERLHFPLKLRTFQPGDRFQPLGMSGSKKLQDFFIDEKIPRSRRGCLPLLVSGEEIIWLAGQRLSDSVKITSKTCYVFKIKASFQALDSLKPA
jgi:tRNA(Ile)-lysidine synthase